MRPMLKTPPAAESNEAEFRASVRSILATSIAPHADRWEAQGFVPDAGWRTFAEHGLLGLDHTGPGFLRSAVFLEELGRLGYAGLRAAVGVHAYMALSYIDELGTPEQRETYLLPAREGRLITGLAITEETAGTDLGDLRTEAEPDSDGAYRVTGRKCFVANGSRADILITVARTGPTTGLAGTSLLIVRTDAPGVTSRHRPTTGWLSADVCDIEFDGVRVPATQLLGRPNRALLHLTKGLVFERLVAAILAVGGVGHCLGLLDWFVRDHRVGDSPLASRQAVRHRIADLSGRYELVRQYVRHAADLHSQGGLDSRVASISKLEATELAVRAAEECVRLHGARGYAAESPVARIHRDAVAGTVAAGPSELMREQIFETNPTAFGSIRS